MWTLAAGVGVAAGPALGGVLTQVFDWRAIFLLQVPVAALGLFALRADPVADPPDEPQAATRGALLADLGIGLLFGALVGALFLSVLLLIPGWGYSPIRGAAIVSVLPVASLLVARLGRSLPDAVATVSGAALLALGLVALALLPRLGAILPLCALALCGAGLGLALPVLSRTALGGTDLTRSTLRTVGARHLGLVASLALVAPLLSGGLPAAATARSCRRRRSCSTRRVGLSTKIAVALDLGRAFDRARAGDLPNLRRRSTRTGQGATARWRRRATSLSAPSAGRRRRRSARRSPSVRRSPRPPRRSPSSAGGGARESRARRPVLCRARADRRRAGARGEDDAGPDRRAVRGPAALPGPRRRCRARSASCSTGSGGPPARSASP